MATKQSKKYSLNEIDIRKVLIHGCMFAIGAIVVYVAELVNIIEFGELTETVALIAGLVTDLARKYLQGK